LQAKLTEQTVARKAHRTNSCKQSSQNKQLQEKLTEQTVASKAHRTNSSKQSSQNKQLQAKLTEQIVASKAHKAYFPTSIILKISSSADVLVIRLQAQFGPEGGQSYSSILP
jgi:hypothetical protein